jgi:hypothetical protein
VRWALLLVPLLLAGCTGSDALGFAEGEPGPREPYYKEHRGLVAGEHAARYELPVEAGAEMANVTVLLDARTNGLPLPDAAPASLQVALLAPDGARVREAELDAQNPRAVLALEGPPAGLYVVEVRGLGAAPEVDGRTYGAAYVVGAEVLYAE